MDHNTQKNVSFPDVPAAQAMPVTPTTYAESAAPYAQQVPVNVQPLATVAPQDANGIRLGAWEADICGCFTHLVPNCCMATFLPCVSIAQIASRMNIYPYGKTMVIFGVLWVFHAVTTIIYYSLVGLTSWRYTYYYSDSYHDNRVYVSHGDSASVAAAASWSWLSWAFRVAFAIGVWQLRTKIRARFQIPGSCFTDCVLSFCCSCCTIAQMATHVKSYQPGSCDFGPVDTLPAFPQQAAFAQPAPAPMAA